MIGRCTRRVTLLVLLLAVGAAVVVRVRATKPAAPHPSWPPFDPAPRTSSVVEPDPPATASPTTPSTTPSTTPEPAVELVPPSSSAAGSARWVAPVDGACPDGYPIKANDNSRIFHVPGGRFYARTVPERCYAAAADAVADGYRQAKA